MASTKEIMSKSVLSDSGIEPFNYSISPYVGCSHACVYCYARFMLRFRAASQVRQWGEFADAKINAPTVLLHEIRRKPKGLTWLSAVTDPYQPIEKKYELTRKCLEVLLAHKFPVWVQTKSSLVMRDADVIVKFPEKDAGFTILTLNDDLRKEVEPGSSPIDERIAALSGLSDKGIRTFAFVGPILPFLSDSEEELRLLVQELMKAGTNQILFDRLNLRWGVWPSIKNFIQSHYPYLLSKYQNVMWRDTNYFEDLKRLLQRICKEEDVQKYELCF